VGNDDEEFEGFLATEEVCGMVQCFAPNCNFFGKMTGYITAEDSKFIQFICPECNSIEKVRNPDFIG
jgi:hypothetical protein